MHTSHENALQVPERNGTQDSGNDIDGISIIPSFEGELGEVLELNSSWECSEYQIFGKVNGGLTECQGLEMSAGLKKRNEIVGNDHSCDLKGFEP